MIKENIKYTALKRLILLASLIIVIMGISAKPAFAYDGTAEYDENGKITDASTNRFTITAYDSTTINVSKHCNYPYIAEYKNYYWRIDNNDIAVDISDNNTIANHGTYFYSSANLKFTPTAIKTYPINVQLISELGVELLDVTIYIDSKSKGKLTPPAFSVQGGKVVIGTVLQIKAPETLTSIPATISALVNGIYPMKQYSGVANIPITTNTTIDAYCYHSAYDTSDWAYNSYQATNKLFAPNATTSTTGPPWVSGTIVTLINTNLVDNAYIKYTTNGMIVTSTTAWRSYWDPFEITQDITVAAIARRWGMIDSDPVYFKYSPVLDKVRPIVADRISGKYLRGTNVKLTTKTTDASIHYTLDGSDPTTGSSLYSISSPIPLNSNTTLKARGFKTGIIDSDIATYEYTVVDKVEAPFATPPPTGSPVPIGMEIELATKTTGARILYSIDNGSMSPETWYSSPIKLLVNTTISAMASKDDMISSGFSKFYYEVQNKVWTPYADITSPGPWVIGRTVKLTTRTADADIYYTLDGSDPTTGSSLYSTLSPIPLNSNTTLKAIGFKTGMFKSDIVTYIYKVKAHTPVASPLSSEILSPTNVTLKTDTTDASIYYTTDGAIPDEGSTLYSTQFALYTNTTLKAISVTNNGILISDVATFNYTVKALAPQADVVSGSQPFKGTRVSLTTESTDAAIYYTTDGVTIPTVDTNHKYTGPISLNEATAVIWAISANPEKYTNSEVSKFNYNVTGLDWKFFVSGRAATITKYVGTDSVVTVPEILGGCEVKTIGERVFYNRPEITSITFYSDSKITKIGKGAFAKTGITSIVIPSGVTEIAPETFSDCINLQNVTLNDQLEKIGAYAFLNCDNITHIDVPEKVKEIASGAFMRTGLSSRPTKLALDFKGDAPKLGKMSINSKDSILYYDTSKKGWASLKASDGSAFDKRRIN